VWAVFKAEIRKRKRKSVNRNADVVEIENEITRNVIIDIARRDPRRTRHQRIAHHRSRVSGDTLPRRNIEDEIGLLNRTLRVVPVQSFETALQFCCVVMAGMAAQHSKHCTILEIVGSKLENNAKKRV